MLEAVNEPIIDLHLEDDKPSTKLLPVLRHVLSSYRRDDDVSLDDGGINSRCNRTLSYTWYGWLQSAAK